MTDTFENILNKFSETYPRASWSPMIYDKIKNLYNIYLHIDLYLIDGQGTSVTSAKADAIAKHTAIISFIKTSTTNNEIGVSENMMKNCASSNYLEKTSNVTEDIRPSDCSKNAESTLPSTKILGHVDQHFVNDRFRILRDFERSYQFLCHWSHIELEASKNDGLYIALNIGDYRFEGCGHTLNEAKIDAIKKFYSSSVNNFFEISEEKNETKSVLENTPSKDQINSSHCANTKSSDCCDNQAPTKKSEKPDISPFLQNRPDENITEPCSFMETYNLRNNIWSPFYVIRNKRSTNNKYYKVVLRIGNKIFQGQGVKKCNAQCNAIKKFKNTILHTHKNTKNRKFIENVLMIGKQPDNYSKSLTFDNKFNGKQKSRVQQ